MNKKHVSRKAIQLNPFPYMLTIADSKENTVPVSQNAQHKYSVVFFLVIKRLTEQTHIPINVYIILFQ